MSNRTRQCRIPRPNLQSFHDFRHRIMTEVVTPAVMMTIEMTIPPDALVPNLADYNTEVWKDKVTKGLKELSSYGILAT